MSIVKLGTDSTEKDSLSKSNHPLRPPVLPRMLRLGLLRLPNLPLHQLLRHLPLRRVRIRAPRMNRVYADVEDVPAAQPA